MMAQSAMSMPSTRRDTSMATTMTTTPMPDIDRRVIAGAIGHLLVVEDPIDDARRRARGEQEIEPEGASARSRFQPLYKISGMTRL